MGQPAPRESLLLTAHRLATSLKEKTLAILVTQLLYYCRANRHVNLWETNFEKQSLSSNGERRTS